MDERGALAKEVRVEPPYSISPAAHAAKQGSYLFDRLGSRLDAVNSSFTNLLQVEQFITGKAYADAYIRTRSQHVPRARPATAMAAVDGLCPEGAVVCLGGIALRAGHRIEKAVVGDAGDPEAGGGIDWSEAGAEYGGQPPYSDVVTAGPYVFVTGEVAIDPATGRVAAEASAPDWIWAGSEVRNEASFLLGSLERRLGSAGASLADVVHVTVFLTDVRDIFDLDAVWRERFGEDPPARTVIPVAGIGVPRWEGPNRGHVDGLVRLEQQARALRPGHGAQRRPISVRGGLAHEAEAILAGEYLWISQQYAWWPDGSQRPREADVREEVMAIFEAIDALCAAAGTEFSNLLQLRAFVRSEATAHAFYATLRETASRGLPVSTAVVVPGPLLVPDASLFVDAVAYVPQG